MSYITISRDDQREMMSRVGITSINELFMDIPGDIQLSASVGLGPSRSEVEVEATLKKIAAKNQTGTSFLGCGSYNHYVPAAVDQLSQRSEFYTAYTPYQPEVSQGTLTAIFEFQTMIARLTGMDVANASLYDGATALAEAVMMVMSDPAKKQVVVLPALHPHYRQVLETYGAAAGFQIVDTSRSFMDSVSETTGALVVQYPDFFGEIPDLKTITGIAAGASVPVIAVVTEAMALGLLRAPGDFGVAAVCGEGQGLGNYQGFGGPALGFLAVKKEYVRRMPGRLVGRTTDSDGKEAYVLTLQTREQHIRRERATSNICTNQGLMALRTVMYLSLTGGTMREIALYNHQLAVRLFKGLVALGCKPLYQGPFFNEFTVTHAAMDAIYQKLTEGGIIPGYLCSKNPSLGLSDAMIIAVTEKISTADVDRFLELAQSALRQGVQS